MAQTTAASRLECGATGLALPRQLHRLSAGRYRLVSQAFYRYRQCRPTLHILRGRVQPQQGVSQRSFAGRASQRLCVVHVRHDTLSPRRRQRAVGAGGPQPLCRLPVVHRFGHIPRRLYGCSPRNTHRAVGCGLQGYQGDRPSCRYSRRCGGGKSCERACRKSIYNRCRRPDSGFGHASQCHGRQYTVAKGRDSTPLESRRSLPIHPAYRAAAQWKENRWFGHKDGHTHA